MNIKHLVAIIYALILLCGCSDYSIQLPNGYCLVRSNDEDMTIANSVSVVVISPKIVGYEVCQHLVVGRVVLNDIKSEEYGDSKPGFFILNTKNGDLAQGLSEEAWVVLLKQNGVNRHLELKRPTWFRAVQMTIETPCALQ